MSGKNKRNTLAILGIVFTFVFIVISIALKNEKAWFIVSIEPSLEELEEGLVITPFELYFRVHDG